MRLATTGLLLGSAAFLVGPLGCTRSAEALSDPLAGAESQPDNVLRVAPKTFHGSRLERAAAQASRFSGKSFMMTLSSRQVGPDTLVFARGWSGEGTGYAEVSVRVFRAVTPDSVVRVFDGVVDIQSAPSVYVPNDPTPLFSLHGCLLQSAPDEFGYFYEATGRDARTALSDSTIEASPPPPGYYRWRSGLTAFERVRPADKSLQAACRSRRSLIP